MLEGVSGKSLINQIQGEIEDLFLLHHARVGGMNRWKQGGCRGVIGSSVHTLPNVTRASVPLVGRPTRDKAKNTCRK